MSAPPLIPPAASDLTPTYHYEKVADSDTSPLGDPKANSSKSLFFGPRKYIGLAALLPFVTVMLWSWGMGTILLTWLLVKRIPPPQGGSSHIFDGYLVVDEGNKTAAVETLDGQETLESAMRGVLIITAISHLSSMMILPLMALGAFHVASKWLDDQAQSKDGPTPLQYGLVMQMCSSGTWNSVLVTLKYLFKRWRSKPGSTRVNVSPLIYRTLSIAGIVLLLRGCVILTDLLLSADLGSAYYLATGEVGDSSISSNLGTQYNEHNGYWEWTNAYLKNPNDTSIDSPWPSFKSKTIAILLEQSTSDYIAMINTSTSSAIQDTSYMAVIVRPPSHLPSQWSWTAKTIGMAARCRPAPCRDSRLDKENYFSLLCPQGSSIPYPSIPIPSFDYMELLINKNTTQYNNILSYTASGELRSTDLWASEEREIPQVPNPSYFVIRLYMDDVSPWGRFRDLKEFGKVVLVTEPWDEIALYLGLCEVSMYHVEVSFNPRRTGTNTGNQDINSQFSLASTPVPMTQDEMTRVFAPIYITPGEMYRGQTSISSTAMSILDMEVVPALQAGLVREMVAPGFSTKASYEFAKQSLAHLSGINTTTIPASHVAESSEKLVSRYPLAKTLAYIGVIYAHGLLAIILFVGVVRKSTKTIVVDEPIHELSWSGATVEKMQKPVPELLLAQSRLTDPLTIVAENFMEADSNNPELSKGTTHVGVLSAQEDAVRMFDIEGLETKHVDVGLIDREEGERWYGLRFRSNDKLVVESEKDV